MRNKLSLLFTLLVISLSVMAENHVDSNKKNEVHIFGHVIDKKTKEHLPYINVIVKGTTIGVTTDGTGHYSLTNVPLGKQVLVAKALGYGTVEKPIVVKEGKSQEVNFEIDEDVISLDQVVVSANRNETTRRIAPTLVNVLDAKIFEKTSASCLAEGLSFQPGVRVENNCQNCGFQQVRINGLEGPYTQILIDSRPIFSALTGVYGLEQIPANMIERVEVMRGGGSALFGSSAIAGVVNIITKEPIRNTASLSHNLTMIGGTRPENATSLNASMVTPDNKVGLYLFGQSKYRAAYDHDGDGYTELGKLNARTLGFRTYYKTSAYSKLTLEYHNMHEFRRGGNKLHEQPHDADIAEQTEHNINGGGLKFDLFSKDYKHRLNVYTSMQHTDRNSYYGTGQDINAYGHTTDLTAVAGTQYSLSMDKLLFMPAEFTGGFEYNYDKLHDIMKGYNRDLEQKVQIGSIFLQNEWKTDRWGFLIGGRFDKHSLIDHVIFSPRANVRFNPTADINLRMSYSSGFRAPQAFDEDLHIAAVGGEAMIIQIDPNLKEEKSQSISTSVDFYHTFGRVQTNFLVEGFYTMLKDAFVLESMGESSEGIQIMERRNGSGAKVMGINLEGRAAFNAWLSLQAGATLQRSRYNEPEKWSDNPNVEPQRKMFRSPDTYGYLSATFGPVRNFSASVTGTYTGSMLVQHMAGFIPEDREETTPDFFDMGVKLSYNIPLTKFVNFEVSAGVKNVFNAYQKDFDQGELRDAGYIYGPSLPRSYFVSGKISF
ncbi:MAG: TonB-dependent receptor [Tannerellaceae bacterium]